MGETRVQICQVSSKVSAIYIKHVSLLYHKRSLDVLMLFISLFHLTSRAKKWFTQCVTPGISVIDNRTF